jgi:hypothetical protein
MRGCRSHLRIPASPHRLDASVKCKINRDLALEKEEPMTQKAMKKLEVLCRSTARYSPTVREKLSLATKGSKESAFAQSAAKYYPALKELAKK